MGTASIVRLVWRDPATGALKELCQYGHCDGDLVGEYLLHDLLDLLPRYSIGGLLERVSQLRVVYEAHDERDSGPEPTADDIVQINPSDLYRGADDWYSLLHDCQGQLARTLASGFFCHFDPDSKYGFEYTIDLDRGRFIAKWLNWDFDLARDLITMRRVYQWVLQDSINYDNAMDHYDATQPIDVFEQKLRDRVATAPSLPEQCSLCNQTRSVFSVAFLVSPDHEREMVARSAIDPQIPDSPIDPRNCLLLCHNCQIGFDQHTIVIESDGRLSYDLDWMSRHAPEVQCRYAAVQFAPWSTKIDGFYGCPTSSLLAWRLELRETETSAAARATEPSLEMDSESESE